MYEFNKYLKNLKNSEDVKLKVDLKIIYLKKLRADRFSRIPCPVCFRILFLSP